jgi:hypothetical protein
MHAARVPVTWRPRVPPLDPLAVLATGPCIGALLARLLQRDDAALARLSGVAGEDLVVIAGPELPWADGVSYLGRDPLAPSLLLPTRREPEVPVGLLQQALLRRLGAPVVLLPGLRACSLAEARPLDRGLLRGFLERG